MKRDELEWNGHMHLSSIPVHRYGNQLGVTTLNFKLVVYAIKSVNQSKPLKPNMYTIIEHQSHSKTTQIGMGIGHKED